MRKSKAETAETRRRIVATAAGLFMDQGIAATGIAEVMEAAGLTQGGFYRHFESKEQLVAEASEAAYERIFEALGKQVANLSPREAIGQVVHLYLYQRTVKNPDHLCPLAHLGSELPNADERIRSVVNAGFQRMVGFLAGLAQQLKIANSMALADAIAATMLGAVMMARVAVTEASASAVLANAERTIDLMVQSHLQ